MYNVKIMLFFKYPLPTNTPNNSIYLNFSILLKLTNSSLGIFSKIPINTTNSNITYIMSFTINTNNIYFSTFINKSIYPNKEIIPTSSPPLFQVPIMNILKAKEKSQANLPIIFSKKDYFYCKPGLNDTKVNREIIYIFNTICIIRCYLV